MSFSNIVLHLSFNNLTNRTSFLNFEPTSSRESIKKLFNIVHFSIRLLHKKVLKFVPTSPKILNLPFNTVIFRVWHVREDRRLAVLYHRITLAPFQVWKLANLGSLESGLVLFHSFSS